MSDDIDHDKATRIADGAYLPDYVITEKGGEYLGRAYLDLRTRLQAAEARAEKAEGERNDFRARLAEVALYTRFDGGVEGPLCIESDPPLGFHAPGSEIEGVCDFCIIHEKARAALSPTPESETPDE